MRSPQIRSVIPVLGLAHSPFPVEPASGAAGPGPWWRCGSDPRPAGAPAPAAPGLHRSVSSSCGEAVKALRTPPRRRTVRMAEAENSTGRAVRFSRQYGVKRFSFTAFDKMQRQFLPESIARPSGPRLNRRPSVSPLVRKASSRASQGRKAEIAVQQKAIQLRTPGWPRPELVPESRLRLLQSPAAGPAEAGSS